MPCKRKPLVERFWKNIKQQGAIPEYRPDLGPCWLWIGSINGHGYGRIGVGGKFGPAVLAHRVSYELKNGLIPNGLTIDHLCRVRACVNPSHLEAVSLAENKRRGFSFGAINARQDPRFCLRGHLRAPTDNRRHGCKTCKVLWNRHKKGQANQA